jgi:DNA-binding MarR family transcriptional regulator
MVQIDGSVAPETETSEAARVGDLLFRFMKRGRRVVDDALADQDLTLPRAKVLGALIQGACPQNALAGTFDLAPRTVTELVDGLEKMGYVERRVDPADRRVRQVHITESGRRAHEQAWAVRTRILERLFGSLPPEELTALGAVLSRLDAEIDRVAVVDDDPTPCGSPPSRP